MTAIIRARDTARDPQNALDVLGRQIGPGDYVAWPISVGSGAGVVIGRVESINYKRKNPLPWNMRPSRAPDNVPCEASVADHYTVTILTLLTTGWYCGERRTRTVQKVGKLVKLDAHAVEAAVADDA